MPQIIPIKDLKDTAKISEMCHETSEPIYVTKNGYGDMVFMSMETFEEMYRKGQIYKKLEISEAQRAAGKVRPAREALKDLKRK